MLKKTCRIFWFLMAVLLLQTTSLADVGVPYTVYGFVYQNDGATAQANATVTLTNADTGESMQTNTSSDGSYIFNLRNLGQGYFTGDPMAFEAVYGDLWGKTSASVGTESPQVLSDIVIGPHIFKIILLPNVTRGNQSVQITVSTLENSTVNATVSGTTIWLSPQAGGNYTGQFTAPSTDGQYNVTVRVRDGKNRTSSDTAVLTVDNTPPVINVTSPVNNSVTSNSTITVNGTTEPGAAVWVNGVPVVVTNGAFNTAVNLSSGLNGINITAQDAAGNNATAVVYVTRSGFYISDIFANSVEIGGTVNISVVVVCEYPIGSAIAVIIAPNATTTTLPMSAAGNTYYALTTPSQIGDYNVTVTVNDTQGNSAAKSAIFEVYNTMSFSGDIIDAAFLPVNTQLKLYRPGTTTLLQNFSTNSNGYYSATVHRRNYDFVLETQNMGVNLHDVNFTSIGSDPIDIDEFSGSDVFILSTDTIKGAAFETSLAQQTSIVFGYSDVANEDWLALYGCGDWDYASRECNSWWMELNSTTDRIANTVTSGVTIFYPAYVVVEMLHCGNSVCETNLSETCANCPQDCGACPIPSGGGRTDVSGIEELLQEQKKNISHLEESISEMKKKLNTTTTSEDVEELKAKIEEQTKLLQEMGEILKRPPGSEYVVPLGQTINAELYPGETMKTKIRVRNVYDYDTIVTANVTGELARILAVDNPRINISAGGESELNITLSVPYDFEPRAIYGDLVVKLGEHSIITNVPVAIRVMTPLEGSVRIDIKTLSDKAKQGDEVSVQVTLYKDGTLVDNNVKTHLILTDSEKQQTIWEATESVVLEGTRSTTETVHIPNDAADGQYIIKGICTYIQQGNRTRDVYDTDYIIVETPLLFKHIYGIPVWLLILIFLFIIALAAFFVLYSQKESRKKRYLEMIDTKNLPQPGERAAFVGMIAESGIRAFMDLDALQTHTLIAGATGGGKTVSGQDIVEEALMKGSSVIVFDPTAQWSGFLRANTDKTMFRLYEGFHIKESDARAFSGNVHTITDVNKMIANNEIHIKDYLKEGEITVFCMHKLDPAAIERVIEYTIKDVFKSNLEDTKKLRCLIVYDEVHRLLPKFGGTGQGLVQLERAVREFRKWGVGLVLISQVLSDFVGEIKANIGTEMQMRTRYEGDLERIKMKYGEDTLKSVVRASIGTGMVQNPAYNKGRPYFITFRPLLHNHSRLSDEILANYDKYNAKIDALRKKLDAMKAKEIDIFDLELELNLALDNVKKGSFDVVELYLESLEPRINSEYDKMPKGEEEKEKYVDRQALMASGSKIEEGEKGRATEEKDGYIDRQALMASGRKIEEGEKTLETATAGEPKPESKPESKPEPKAPAQRVRKKAPAGRKTKDKKGFDEKEAALDFDRGAAEGATIEDIDVGRVRTFLKGSTTYSAINPNMPLQEILERLNLVSRQEGVPLPTKTAILFFGKDPQRFVPQSEVKMARFSGRDVGEFIDETRLHATIPEMIESVEKFIRRNVRKSMAISGDGFKREDSPEYPYAALREATVNAIAHRDYSITGATVRIMIFDDRIEIDNPGAAIGGMDVKDLEGKHITRNNNICRLLYELGGMEEYGTGMKRMRKLMKESGLKEPVFEEGVGFFRVTFYGPKDQNQNKK